MSSQNRRPDAKLNMHQAFKYGGDGRAIVIKIYDRKMKAMGLLANQLFLKALERYKNIDIRDINF